MFDFRLRAVALRGLLFIMVPDEHTFAHWNIYADPQRNFHCYNISESDDIAVSDTEPLSNTINVYVSYPHWHFISDVVRKPYRD